MLSGDKLKTLRKKANYQSQQKLAEVLNVSRATVYDWERGKYFPEGKNLINLAKALNVSVAYLIEETDDPTPKTVLTEKLEPMEDRHFKIIRNGKEYPEADWSDELSSRVGNGLQSDVGQKDTSHQTPQIDDVIFVPIVSNKVITACCGNGSAYAEDVVWEYEGRFPVPAKILMGYTWQGCSYRIMEAEGSSMEPYIYSGDKVLFVKYCEAGVGDIVVVSINNRLFIKGIVKMNEKELCLRAYNWQISPDMMVNLEGDTEVCILGKVINVVSARSIPKMI